MSDDEIPTRLAALDKAWEWVSDASSRINTVTNDLSSLKTRLDAIDDEGVSAKAVALVEGDENALPDITDKLKDSKENFENSKKTFDETFTDLTKRMSEMKTQVGG